MPTLKLDILVVPTYNAETLGVADASTYPTTPPNVSSPSIEITVPSFGSIVLPFNVNDFNIFTSASLGLTQVGDPLVPLPDGVYTLKYTVAPAYLNYVTKTIIRVDQLQEKFDEAFMKLDMMECDKAIKTQAKVDLNTIYFFIQGAIAAANNCAVDTANKLYDQASKMLANFVKNNCGCSGNNYVINFY